MSDEVPDAENILRSLKMQGDVLTFSFLNGSPIACALRALLGKLDPKEVLGLSKEMQAKDDGIPCVAKPFGPLQAETKDEGQVYEIQLGSLFDRTSKKFLPGMPMNESCMNEY